MLFLENSRGSLLKLVRTAMWRKSHRGVRRSLRSLLLEKNNPFVVEKNYKLVHELLSVHEWTPVKKVLSREVQAFGKHVIQKFQVPQVMDENMNLAEQIIYLKDEQYGLKYAPKLFQLLAHCMAARRKDSPRKTPWSSVTMITAQLAWISRPRTYNRLATCLSMLLSHYHLTKHGLQILNALGVSASFAAVNARTNELQDVHKKTLQQMSKHRDRQIVWDNLNRNDNVRE